MTNGDKIRNASDELLAEMFTEGQARIAARILSAFVGNVDLEKAKSKTKQQWLEWLKGEEDG